MTGFLISLAVLTGFLWLLVLMLQDIDQQIREAEEAELLDALWADNDDERIAA